MFKKIMKEEVKLPEEFSESLKSLLQGLLSKNVEERFNIT